MLELRTSMRRNIFFVLYLAVLSVISGWLMSRMSWIGRVGVNLMHKEYKFLKIWYEGGGVVFIVLLLFFVMQYLAQRKLPHIVAQGVHGLCLTVATIGLWATYSNFRTDLSHNLLRERFHLGAYLFWIGWISICMFMFTTPKRMRPIIKGGDRTALRDS